VMRKYLLFLQKRFIKKYTTETSYALIEYRNKNSIFYTEGIMMAVRLSSDALVAVHRTRLVMGWVTVFRRVKHQVFSNSFSLSRAQKRGLVGAKAPSEMLEGTHSN